MSASQAEGRRFKSGPPLKHMYHAILVDQAFTSLDFTSNYSTFGSKQDGSWRIFGIEVEDSEVQPTIKQIQSTMKDNQPWYAHLYNDSELIVVFKNQTFTVTPHKSSWQPIIDYGRTLNIPPAQLDFWPNRFQDEIHYFQTHEFNTTI